MKKKRNKKRSPEKDLSRRRFAGIARNALTGIGQTTLQAASVDRHWEKVADSWLLEPALRTSRIIEAANTAPPSS